MKKMSENEISEMAFIFNKCNSRENVYILSIKVRETSFTLIKNVKKK